ncbi:hypothetical protein AgCh_030471 [Apium graveolens]
MVYVRQIIVSDSSVALPSSYYRHKQHKLFPLLASAYAFRFAGQLLSWLYKDVIDKLQANDFSTLPEAHACTAGLKSLTTSATTANVYHATRSDGQELAIKVYKTSVIVFKTRGYRSFTKEWEDAEE